MNIVGIGFRAKQGKTTLAHNLQAHLITPERRVIVYNLSDALCQVCRIQGWMKSEKDDRVLQIVGELYRNTVGDGVWISMLHAKIFNDDRPDIAIVAGLRHPNELEWLYEVSKESGGEGVTVLIERTMEDGTPFKDTKRNLAHLTEMALAQFDQWDYTVKCPDGNLSQLRADAESLAGTLKNRWNL